MEEYAGKRSVERLVVPRKASGLVLRENVNKKDDKNVSFCSRMGCTTKVISTKGTRVGSTDNKTKIGRPPISSSSNGKQIIGSSSRPLGAFGHLGKPAKGIARRQPSCNMDTDSSEASSFHDDPAAAEPTLPCQKTKRDTINVHSQTTVSGEVVMKKKAESSGRGASRNSQQKSDLRTRDALTGHFVSSSSNDSEHTVKAGVSRNRLRNLRCNSVSDVLQNNSVSATRSCATKRKTSGESSSPSKGNKNTALVPKGKNQITSNGNGITISDNRRNRVVPTIRDNSVVSSSGRKSGYVGRSGRLGAVASTSLQTPRPATPTNPNPSLSISPSNSYSRPNSSIGQTRCILPGSPSEANPSVSLGNRDGFGLSRSNMNGIAEVLLALERIEHDGELTYEQLASLETNLFSSGIFRFYDQHRDMRMDIDNMSYEELLALGDEMGTVSTALSEEALSRSLKKSIYQETDETSAVSLNKDDDLKCSICQEEYVEGDEVGTMPCQHMYHVNCAQQWLRMKNWCPICKTSAEEEDMSC